MIVLEQRLLGVLCYRKAFFPTPAGIKSLTDSLSPNQMIRFSSETPCITSRRYLVERHPVSTVCIDLRQGLDTIQGRMQPRACRQRIRRAEKMLDRVRIDANSETATADFLRLYRGFAASKGLVPRVSRAHLKDYLKASDVSVLYLDGRAMCGHVTLRDPESRKVMLMFSGSSRFESQQDSIVCGALNRYLHWHELQEYRQQGMEVYDFGGIGHRNPYAASFNQFKLSFGGDIVTEYCHTFSGTPRMARVMVEGYNRLRASRFAGWLSHV